MRNYPERNNGKAVKACLLACLGFGLDPTLVAQEIGLQQLSRYQVGDLVDNISLVEHGTGKSVELYDFEGSVLFLEWFAWWCPFCRAAAGDVEEGIVGYYREKGGNAFGAPVKHIGLNLQSGQATQTQNFIDTYHLGVVLNDFNRAFSNRFSGGGQPIFAIINGLKDSPSHRQWELIYSRNGYGDLSQPIETFRAAIDRVEPSAGGLTYGMWIEFFALDPTQSSTDQDPDRDGYVNAWEFATGTDPLDPDSHHRPRHESRSDGMVHIVFQAAEDLIGVKWEVYKSDDLREWLPIGDAAISQDPPEPGNPVTTLSVALSIGQESTGFYRVGVVLE